MAREYAAARPGYPPEFWAATAERRPGAPAPAVDLAAGTGAATVDLVATGGPVIAVEASPVMVARAAERLRGQPDWAGAAAGRAEAIPLATASVGLVTVAQAFHWFEAVPALDEIARVLAPGGLLALFWNVSEEDPFMEDVRILLGEYNPGYGRPVTRAMLPTPEALTGHPEFRVEPPRLFPHARPMTVDRFVAYAFSWSYGGGALEPDRWAPFERELRARIDHHHGDEPWEERLVTAAHFARRA